MIFGKCEVVLRLKKSLYGQTEAECLWSEKWFVRLRFCDDQGLYLPVIYVVYVDGCLFWESSQSDIDNVMKYFKEGGTS